LHKKLDRAYIGGGAFSANPITMTSGRAMLSFLKKNKSVYSKIGKLGQHTRKELDKTFDGKVITTGMGSLFMTHFVSNGITQIRNATDAALCNTDLLHRYHFELIAKDGIFFLPGKLGAISYYHSQSDVKDLIDASNRFSASI
jgi:glutamate-1-semialdehyde 2,1-aminomutase